MDDKIVVGLDIGTTKVCVIAGRKNEYGKIEVLGFGKAPLEEGVVRSGIVTKIDRTSEAIHQAIHQLQTSVEGHISVGEVNVNIDSIHIKGIQHRLGLTRRNTQEEISIQDVAQLNEDMQRVTPPLGSQNIHVLPQKYRVDGESGVIDPVGMLGVRLDADFYVISVQSTVMQNLGICMRRAGLEVNKVFFSPLASGLAVLSEDEKEQGVVLVDIGGGTTDVVIYHEGIVRHVAVLPFGGDVITRDISHGCGVTRNQAEVMKVKYGMATPEFTSHKDRIVVPGLRDRQPTLVSMKNVAQIIEARLTEIIEMVYMEIEKSGYKSRIRNVGIVLTGGTALLQNIDKLFEELTDMPTRIGNSGEHLGLSPVSFIKEPCYATAVGMVLVGFHALDARENRYQQIKPTVTPRNDPPKTNNGGGLFGKIRTWLSEDLEDKNDY
ncbi:cell division protein FtsA [Cytophagaceae bacterium DM2B3-1]|uniref:Cell division protein FtsA n=1 Tax=Xanthocytophaga flava TaxID=3048013 RepID=A0ABT7CRI7_9BACT|nr:cell division protein FtsA [Xanthocytophaga flavus]MDJ1468589.1 cell division protein FtsA [Xanthocytophaga flavus]MDJ1496369.1 cell division protein FtsA [Xanthocytophaga flavus]